MSTISHEMMWLMVEREIKKHYNTQTVKISIFIAVWMLQVLILKCSASYYIP